MTRCSVPPTKGGGRGIGFARRRGRIPAAAFCPTSEPGVAGQAVVGQIVEVGRVERGRLRGIHADQHIVCSCRHGSRARAMRSLDLDVIGLEALVDRLHGVVYGDLHQRRVHSAASAGTPGRDRLLCDLIPIDYRVGAAPGPAANPAHRLSAATTNVLCNMTNFSPRWCSCPWRRRIVGAASKNSLAAAQIF